MYRILSDPNETGKFPTFLLIGILGGSLTFVIILTAILFYIYSKRIRNRIVKEIANQQRPESCGFEGYDDIDFTPHSGGKDMYATYEAITEEDEVRYTQNKGYSYPSLTAEQDYVQMPHNIQIHSRADNRQIPISESAYLEMSVVPKSKPRVLPRRSLKREDNSEYSEMKLYEVIK